MVEEGLRVQYGGGRVGVQYGGGRVKGAVNIYCGGRRKCSMVEEE